MKMKFLILVTVITLLAPLLVLVGSSSAVDVFPVCGSGAAQNSSTCKDIGAGTANPVITVLRTVINIISFIIGISAIIVIIISGLRMIVSGGDPNNIKLAREAIIYALVGVMVALVAQAIVVFVLNKLK